MSFVSQALGGNKATKSIQNIFNTAGFAAITINSQVGGSSAKAVASGALTANTLATVFSAANVGILMPLLTIRTADSTSRTLRVVIEVDGITAFDRTSAAITTGGNGICLAGSTLISSSFSQCAPITSKSNLDIKIASSLTETDKFIIEYHYQELI